LPIAKAVLFVEPVQNRGVNRESAEDTLHMANRDILAIGASAGGVEALSFLAQNFPRDFPAAVLVTVHLSSEGGSVLDEILGRSGPLPAVFATDNDRLRKARIYVAPANRHLIVEDDRLVLGHGSRENNARPAIDAMMRSAAACCGPRTVGVVLTGTLSDGASGLWAIDQCGGITVVQDPADAEFSDMPTNALNRMKPDHVVSLTAMPKLLNTLVSQPAGESSPIPESVKFEVEIARGYFSSIDDMDRFAGRSGFACPDCHGAMWEIKEGDLVRYRCHVGHTYAADLMSIALDENLRRALGSALRALEERRALARRLENQSRQNNHLRLASSWATRAEEYERELHAIRSSVRRLDDIAPRGVDKRAAE
jgi:two-component system, chemotaxis family, protein-glutamate methylesterase/glutaminase